VALSVVPEGVPLVLAGGGMLLVALAVLLIDFSARVNRAFASFLVLRGGVNVLTAIRLGPEGVPEELAFALIPYFVLGLLPATIWFYLVYRRVPGTRGRAWTLAALLAATIGIEAVYAMDHALYRDTAGGYGPIYLAVGAGHLGYALVAWGLARAHVHAPPGGKRSVLLLSAVGFALNPLFLALHHLVTYDVAGLWPSGETAWFRANHWVELAALAPIALVLVEIARAARRAPDGRSRRHARLALASFALPLLSASWLLALSGPWAPTGALREATYNAMDGLWALSLPLLVGYGLAKRQLFDIDLKLRWTLSRGTLVAAFVGAFLVASRLAEIVIEPRFGAAVGIAAVALLLFAILPLVSMGERVASAILPGVEREDRLNERKVEVYRAALESALADDGVISPEQDRILASLRARLGITDRDHDILAFAMRNVAPAPESEGELILGRYRLERLLGEGGQGRTWLAEDETLGRRVVVKLLHPGATDVIAMREARAIASVRHPNVVTLYDVERAGDRVVLVMEHMEGGSLAERVRDEGPVRGADFDALASGLLDALGSVHVAGAVHRDVKPSNVLLTRRGEPKLADFGVARTPGMETTVGAFDHDARPGGTVRFMSPEQARGRRVTPRSDVFSAAATLWEAWTGRAYLEPRHGESAAEVRMRAAAAREPAPPEAMPPALAAWFLRALDPSPARRFADGAEARAAFGAREASAPAHSGA